MSSEKISTAFLLYNITGIVCDLWPKKKKKGFTVLVLSSDTQ